MALYKSVYYYYYFLSPPAQSHRQKKTRIDIQNYGCNGNLLCYHGVVERNRISSLQSHGKALKQECCLPGVRPLAFLWPMAEEWSHLGVCCHLALLLLLLLLLLFFITPKQQSIQLIISAVLKNVTVFLIFPSFCCIITGRAYCKFSVRSDE